MCIVYIQCMGCVFRSFISSRLILLFISVMQWFWFSVAFSCVVEWRGQRSRSPGTRKRNVHSHHLPPPRGDGMVPSAACSMLQCIVIGGGLRAVYVMSSFFFVWWPLALMPIPWKQTSRCVCVCVCTWCGGRVCYFVVRCICEIGCLQWTGKCSWSVLSTVSW